MVRGLLIGLAATLLAGCGGSSGNGFVPAAASAPTPPMLSSIDVAPGDPSIASGRSQQFTATGNYSDGSMQDLTAVATWTSSDPTVASAGGAGLVTGNGVGSATIAATF